MKPHVAKVVLVVFVMMCSSLTHAQRAARPESRGDDHGSNGLSAGRSIRFVGVTTDRFTGSGTRSAMTLACSVQFRGARLAFSDEYALSFNPAPVSEAAWVQPRVAFGQFTPGTAPIYYDGAGNRVFPESSCGYWTSESGVGTLLLPSGALSEVYPGESCATPHPVACVRAEQD